MDVVDLTASPSPAKDPLVSAYMLRLGFDWFDLGIKQHLLDPILIVCILGYLLLCLGIAIKLLSSHYN